MADSEKEKRDQALFALQLGLQQAVENQSRLASLTSRCYKSCTDRPGRSLSNHQKQCIWNCAQRWAEVQHFVNSRSQDLLIRQRNGLGGSLGSSQDELVD